MSSADNEVPAEVQAQVNPSPEKVQEPDADEAPEKPVKVLATKVTGTVK